MKHVIFTDIDGTIYSHDDFQHPDVARDITLAQSKGVEVVLCTGNGAFPKITNLAKSLNIRYIISSNGAWIYDMEGSKTIYKNVIPLDYVKQLVDYANEIGATIGMWNEEAFYASSNIEERKSVVNKFMGNVDIKHTDDLSTDVFMITKHGDPEKLQKIVDKAIGLGLKPTVVRYDFVEISFGTSTKGTGILEFCKQFDIDLSKTMGIGDSHNDVSMFEVVEHSYAMDNAPQEIKDTAMHHAADVRQNGLGMSIIDYLHREKLDRGA